MKRIIVLAVFVAIIAILFGSAISWANAQANQRHQVYVGNDPALLTCEDNGGTLNYFMVNDVRTIKCVMVNGGSF